MARNITKKQKIKKANIKTDNISNKRKNVKKLEHEILKNAELDEKFLDEKIDDISSSPNEVSNLLEKVVFFCPTVDKPLDGTPKEVRIELDNMVKKLQKKPDNNDVFDRIHHYMHCYLINLVLKRFPYIKGYQTVDIYQEALIALRFKAIPGFQTGKGMSFLNFAKMCIRRHLITILNASFHRKKDRSMNRSISLDSLVANSNDQTGEAMSIGNTIPDEKNTADKNMENMEAYNITKKSLMCYLSDFEKIVLNEYLNSSSYCEISKNISDILSKKYKPKSIDNALLRIRKKAAHMLKITKVEDIPMFIEK